MKNYKTLIKHGDIVKRIKVLAKEIDEKYKNENVIFVCVLKGAFVFFSELIKHIKNQNIEIDFIQLKSYVGKNSTGEVKLVKDVDVNIENKHVVIVEDIVDTGFTAEFLFNTFSNRKTKSVIMCSLLQKPYKLKVKLNMPLMVGFEIPNEFIVGYGLDYNEKYRTLKNIKIF